MARFEHTTRNRRRLFQKVLDRIELKQDEGKGEDSVIWCHAIGQGQVSHLIDYGGETLSPLPNTTQGYNTTLYRVTALYILHSILHRDTALYYTAV